MNFIENWRIVWWRKWSTWLAALNGLFVGYVFSQPVLLIGLIGFAPAGWMVPLAVIAALLAFGLPVLVAHLHQPKLKSKIEEKRDGAA